MGPWFVPLSALWYAILATRHALYNWGLLRSERSLIPTLVVGNMEGTLQMLENVGGVYSLLDDDASPVAGIQLSNYTHPSLADVDGDGDADLLVGAADNELHYFENVGTSSAPSFVARYGDDVPLGLASLRSDERVRLRVALG